MHSSRFPCRVCGQATDGLDTYVVCLACAEEYELRSEGSAGGRPDSVRLPTAFVVPTGIPLSDDEIQERLRHLLNDW
jgi:hypothetical protein